MFRKGERNGKNELKIVIKKTQQFYLSSFYLPG